jgi:hypothetical protein
MAMNENRFWEIIEQSRAGSNGSQSAQKTKLKKLLSEFELPELIAFDKIFDQMLASSYTWDLWAAAYIINGGCSDDSFEYFRRGLIASGRQRFESALQDPQSLGDWVEPDELEFEDFKYAVYDVYNEKTGTKDIPDHGLKYPSSPSGEEWSEDGDDLEERFPRLWAKYST